MNLEDFNNKILIINDYAKNTLLKKINKLLNIKIINMIMIIKVYSMYQINIIAFHLSHVNI